MYLNLATIGCSAALALVFPGLLEQAELYCGLELVAMKLGLG